MKNSKPRFKISNKTSKAGLQGYCYSTTVLYNELNMLAPAAKYLATKQCYAVQLLSHLTAVLLWDKRSI